MAEFFRKVLSVHQSGPLPVGSGEVVIAWEESGLWFRSLIDHLSSDLCFVNDIKTTGQTIPPWDCGRKLAEDGWDVQAAMIERGLNVLDPKNAGRRVYRFILIEQVPPFGVVVNQLTEANLSMGRRKLQQAIYAWKDCLGSGVWPAYPPVIHFPEYPPYAAAKWEEREAGMIWGASQ